ncbi:hypothetical protein J2S44_002394 [Catenuloplanes niger]|uniref:Uncharacterized protein n=1 Tax=Catenuloplanes niger TaxID=587534 RepID=A0AAE3ZLI9_9ACTN|nr:hypothetical protein [Catenuloplanes niger]
MNRGLSKLVADIDQDSKDGSRTEMAGRVISGSL